MLDDFLRVNKEYKTVKNSLFPIIKKYIYEYEGYVEEILDVTEFGNGLLQIEYGRTFRGDWILNSVVVKREKIEMACRGEWDKLAKEYQAEHSVDETSLPDVTDVDLNPRTPRIKQIISEIANVNVNNIALNNTLKYDLFFDSLDTIDLVVWLEDEFKITLLESDVNGMKTVGDVVDTVNKLCSGDSKPVMLNDEV